MTNNSTKSRKQYGKKFETLGLSVDEVVGFFSYRHELVPLITSFFLLLTDEAAQEEIFASSFAAAAYLQSIDFPKDKKVHRIISKRKNKTVTAVFHMIRYELCKKYDIVFGAA